MPSADFGRYASALFVCAVQHEAIPQALMRQDILCQAKSGMGKTAVFVISILQNLEPKKGVVQALVLCHTRELSFQVSQLLQISALMLSSPGMSECMSGSLSTVMQFCSQSLHRQGSCSNDVPSSGF